MSEGEKRIRRDRAQRLSYTSFLLSSSYVPIENALDAEDHVQIPLSLKRRSASVLQDGAAAWHRGAISRSIVDGKSGVFTVGSHLFLNSILTLPGGTFTARIMEIATR
jgi:hypothetical protein